MLNSQTAQVEHKHDSSTRRIWKVFWILLVITIFEVIWGMQVSHHMPRWVNALFFLTLTLAKATYIVADFMHLRTEIKNLIRTIVIPLMLFIWFIIAFCWDGNSWENLRTKYHKTGFNPKVEAPMKKHGDVE